MVSLARRRTRGWTFVEILAVTGAMAILLSMGIMVHRSMRMSAKVTVAENSLKQIATGLELYFQTYRCYPPQGSDLVTELAPFVQNPEAFANPMCDESYPGETLNALYVQPTLEELDSPDHYVTAMVASNGKTAIILKTGHKVERHDNLRFIPEDLNDALAAILDPPFGYRAESEQEGAGQTAPEDDEDDNSLSGLINLNPRNNDDYQFVLLAGSRTITRDTLHDSNGTLSETFNDEPVVMWLFPKGNGNQNSLTVGGDPYSVRNGTLYRIDVYGSADAPAMVKLYNVSCNGNGDGGQRNGNGKAMGRWWIEINAKDAEITEYGPGCSGESPINQ